MKARKGEWFSLSWDITDLYDPEAFKQHELAPRFLYAEEDSEQIEAGLADKFTKLRLVSILLTSVFITEDHGIKVPTHYRIGEFMPGDRPKYDKWLAEYHKIKFNVAERIRDKEALQQKKVFLEHTAKIIRHDMHSGINTYLPRGVKSLLKKLPATAIKKHKLEGSIKLLEEGIAYTQKVYEGVYAFTNLVKEDSVLDLAPTDLGIAIREFIETNPYNHQVFIEDLPAIPVHKVLFCTAIDYLIKGGLKFNDNEEKWVKIYMEGDSILCVEDNGIGLSREDFLLYCKPYIREETKTSSPQGLELNIAVAILEDHGFLIEPEKIETGTIFKIDLNPKEFLIRK